MPIDPELTYGFGGFTLFPESKVLLHGESRVFLPGKDFEILSYLVRHHGNVVRSVDLAAEVWGDGKTSYSRHVAHRVSRLRKALGCDPNAPSFIKTFYLQKGYKFIASVTKHQTEPRFSPNGKEKASTYRVKLHLFIPMFMGSNRFAIRGKAEGTDLENVEFELGTLFLNSSGFAVWHLVEVNDFQHLWNVAERRKKLYGEILANKHSISALTHELFKSSKPSSIFQPILQKPGYILSVAILQSTTHRNPVMVERTVQLLATPTILEGDVATPDAIIRQNARERRLLETTRRTEDLTEFGLTPTEIGFASWDGVAYFSTSPDVLEPRIIEIEVEVQILWWMCKCSTQILLEGDINNIKAVRKWIPEIKRQFAKIRNIGATESPSQRTMREAILKTSRLKEMVDEVLELSQDLAP